MRWSTPVMPTTEAAFGSRELDFGRGIKLRSSTEARDGGEGASALTEKSSLDAVLAKVLSSDE